MPKPDDFVQNENGTPARRTKEQIETAAEKPPPVRINAKGIPQALKDTARFVLWKWERRKGKDRWAKVPWDAQFFRHAKSDDPSSWGTLDRVRQTWSTNREHYDGLGFMFAAGDGFVGIDLDSCIDLESGKLKPWAERIVAEFATYAEVSPTETGLKLWVKATKPGDDWCKEPYADGEVEMYDRLRYFTVTGHHWPGAPETIEERQEQVNALYQEVLAAKAIRDAEAKPKKTKDATRNGEAGHPGPPPLLTDDEIIDKASKAKNGGKFRALMAGNASEYDGDASRADSALCCLLAFYTKDPNQIDHVFRTSGLMRDKWDEARKDSTYGRDTISRALEQVTEQWTPKRRRRRQPTADGHAWDGNGQPASCQDDRPQILVSHEEHAVNDRVIAALPKAPDLFQRGNRLVNVLRDTAAARLTAISRPAGTPTIAIMPAPRLREIMTREMVFGHMVKKKEGYEFEPCHPPDWSVSGVWSRRHWPNIRHLEAVIEAPTLRPDGTLLDAPGWDEATGLLYEPNAEYPLIPQAPSRADAVRAADMLLDLVSEFPFARLKEDDEEEDDGGRTHRAAFLAACITPHARFAIRGPCPLFEFDANCPGTGKSKLTDVTARIATGRDMSRTTFPDNDEEMRKRVTSIAIAGDLLMLLDNIDRPLGGAPLDALLTATIWKDRILGKSEMTAELPLHTVWYATGNNITHKGDIIRRILPVRLNTQEECPEERSGFKYPRLLEHVAAERPRLVCACLTILRAYFAAGNPPQGLTSFGSYESWSDVVRAPVAWVLGVDPCGTRRGMRAADPKTAALASLLAGWAELPGGSTGLTVAEAVRILENPDSAAQFCTLRDALMEDSKNGKLSPAAVAYRLRSARGRVVSGRKMDTTALGAHGGVQRWRVVEVGDDSVPF
jgi:hypothetical protein